MVTIERVHQLITEIFYRILIIFRHSTFFSTFDKIKLIIIKVCWSWKTTEQRFSFKINNQIINRCVRSIKLQPIFDGHIEQNRLVMDQCFEILEIYLQRSSQVTQTSQQRKFRFLFFLTERFSNFIIVIRPNLFRSILLNFFNRFNHFDNDWTKFKRFVCLTLYYSWSLVSTVNHQPKLMIDVCLEKNRADYFLDFSSRKFEHLFTVRSLTKMILATLVSSKNVETWI